MTSHKQKELPGGGAQIAKQVVEGDSAIVTPAGAAQTLMFGGAPVRRELDQMVQEELRLTQLLPHRHVSTRTIRRQVERDLRKAAKKGGVK